MDHGRSVRVAFETARLQLAELRADTVGARRSAYEIACRLSASTLAVDRVSIWLLADDGARIDCATLYSRRTGEFSTGGTIERRTCPRYFEAMLSRRVIAAADALVDAKTVELRDYLQGADVGALLDAPIYRDGEVIGVVCHEQCGSARTWTEPEASFAGAVADMLTILIEQADRAELRAALAQEREIEARAQKMTALQRLARVVAHDLNNVLTVAMARTALLADSSPREAQESADVTSMLEYAARLVKQLITFSQDRAEATATDVSQLLATLAPTLRALGGKGVTFDVRLEAGSLVVPVSELEMEQLVLNLCMNAVDAVTGAGRVTVTLAREPGTGRALLAVEDTGVGMDEATQARIFEPYYSTKQDHSGVGLMAVYGIVQRAGGAIWLDSAPGKGTRFRIALPAKSSPGDVSDAPPWAFG